MSDHSTVDPDEKPVLEIGYSNICLKVPCDVCGRIYDSDLGPVIVVAETNGLVCRDCAAEIDLDLLKKCDKLDKEFWDHTRSPNNLLKINPLNSESVLKRLERMRMEIEALKAEFEREQRIRDIIEPYMKYDLDMTAEQAMRLAGLLPLK